VQGWRTSIVAALVVVMAVASVAPARTRRDDTTESGRKVMGVRPWAYKYLEEAYTTLEKESYPDTLATLDHMRRKDRRLNAHERALMWQTYAYVYAAQEHYQDAIGAFEKALMGDAMPDAAMQNVRYNLAQLYLVLERYDDAIAGFQTWLQHTTEPTPNGYFMLAMAYLQKNDAEKALVYARQVVSVAGEHPREPWLQLLASLLMQNGAYKEAAPVMEQLVALFPKKSYFTQLSALYGELGQHDRSLATLELAYVQGLLDDGQELKTLAQLYLYNQVPVKAAHVLEEAAAAGLLPDDSESWQLLGEAWLQAKERDKAMEPLTKAARLAPNGEAWMRLARVQLDEGDWGAARDSLNAAIHRGGLSDPGSAYVLIGITHVSQDQLVAARTAFEQAKTYATTEDVAVQWLATVDSQLRVLDAEKATADATATRGGVGAAAAAKAG
jgi:tetratricopeptide (TPR) repeat protein